MRLINNNKPDLKQPTRRQLELLDDNEELNTSLMLLRRSFSNVKPSSSMSMNDSRSHIVPKGTSATAPATPASRKEAVRSILREPNTPGTGQSVRFFSRDAFKVISPLPSTAPSPSGSPFMNQVWRLPEPEELHEDALSDLHETKGVVNEEGDKSASLMLGGEDGGSNLFDMSLDMPPIPTPADANNMLSDDAVEVSSLELTASNPPFRDTRLNTSNQSVGRPINESRSFNDVSTDALRVDGDDHQSFDDRSSFYPAAPGQWIATPRKAQANKSFVPDHSTSYWTPRSIFPSFSKPTSSAASTESQQAPLQPKPPSMNAASFLSSHLALITALREELDLQKKINQQIELDLANRDEMVDILSARVENAENECEEWRTDEDAREREIQSLKKQLGSLEKMCLKLREIGFDANGVSTKRRDVSLDKSIGISDEVKGDALKMLKERIQALEDEKHSLCLEASDAKEEIEILRERLKNGEDDNSDIVGLIDERNELREKVVQLEEADALQRGEIEELKRRLKESEQRSSGTSSS